MPDWAPYLRAEGARRRAERAVHRLGRRRLRHDGLSSAVRSRRRTCAASPTWACASRTSTRPRCARRRASSLLTGRNATTQRHGDHRRVQLGLPRHLDPHPVRERVHLRGARRARLQHVLRREVAPHPGRGVQPRRVQGPLAARARASSASTGSSAASRTSGIPTSSTTTSQIDAPGDAGGGLPPRRRTSPTRRSVHPGRQGRSTPTSRSSCTSRPDAGHAPHHVFKEWADKYKGTFDQGYEAIRAEILARQKELGLLPDDTELSPINPHGEPARTGPDGQPWPAARHRASVGLAQRRRAAPLRPHGRGVRRLRLVHRRPDRSRARLPRGSPASSTTRSSSSSPTTAPAARAARTASFNEWRFFNGVADTTEPTLPHIDELGSAAVVQPLQHRLGVGVRHAVPVLEAVGRLRGRRRRHVPGRVAGADQAVRSEVRHQYVHAVDVVPTVYDLLGIEPPDGRSRATRRARSRARASRPRSPTRRRPGRRTQFYAMLGQRSIYHEGWLACTVHPPLERLGQVRARRVGALRPRARPLAVEERRRRTSRSGSRR